jgi:hypothetical protein
MMEMSALRGPHLHKQVYYDDKGRMTIMTFKYNHMVAHSKDTLGCSEVAIITPSLKTLCFHFWDTLYHPGVPEYEKYFKNIILFTRIHGKYLKNMMFFLYFS